MFKNYLAELAYQAFARPIVLSIVGSLGGVMGLLYGATLGSSAFGNLG